MQVLRLRILLPLIPRNKDHVVADDIAIGLTPGTFENIEPLNHNINRVMNMTLLEYFFCRARNREKKTLYHAVHGPYITDINGFANSELKIIRKRGCVASCEPETTRNFLFACIREPDTTRKQGRFASREPQIRKPGIFERCESEITSKLGILERYEPETAKLPAFAECEPDITTKLGMFASREADIAMRFRAS